MRFLQKINIYYYILALILFMFLIPHVFALYNDESSYNLTMPDYNSQLSSFGCSDTTMKEFVDNFITSFDDTYFELYVANPLVGSSSLSIRFYIIPKDRIQYSYYSPVVSANNYPDRLRLTSKFRDSGTINFGIYTFNSSLLCNNAYQSRTDWNNFISYIENNGGSTASDNFLLNQYNGLMTYSNDYQYQMSSSLSDNNSDVDFSMWYYYSSFDFTYHTTQTALDNSNSYYKKLCITDNNTCYEINNSETLPSYYDLHNSIPEPQTYIGYSDGLNTFYTNLAPSSVNNYNLSVGFRVPQSLLGSSQNPQEYVDNTSFSYSCSGRVDHTNYYTYDKFNCSLVSVFSISDDRITYNFNNVSTSQNLSNYDKLYITINTNYSDSNINKIVYDLSYNYTFGGFFNTEYKGLIYEDLTNLPLNFRIYTSSNNNSEDSSLYVRKYNSLNYGINYRGYSNINYQTNMIVGSSILGNTGQVQDFIKLEVSNNVDTGAMIYQKDSAMLVPRLDLFFNNGIVLSINNNSSSDTFYYVDSEGNILSNSFVLPTSESTNSYDISYYVNTVNNFLNGLSADTLQFSDVMQSFYNGLPLFFQTFIFVVFILMCMYFTYLIIKRK